MRKSSRMTEIDSRPKTRGWRRGSRVSQLDRSDFSRMPDLGRNRQEKRQGDSLPQARPGTFNPSPRKLRPSLPPDPFKRRPEIPACKSFRRGARNAFLSWEMARDGRIGKPGFALLKNAMCGFMHAVKRTTAFLVGRILRKAGRRPPPREVPQQASRASKSSQT